MANSYQPFSEDSNNSLIVSASHSSNSIDTTPWDSYRQGVELTREGYYFKGIVKIHSGEPNHQIPQRQFGEQLESEIFPIQAFRDCDNVTSAIIMSATVVLTGARPMTGYPQAVFKTTIQNETNIFNGVIEPLSIRTVPKISGTFQPIKDHLIQGNVESANFNRTSHSDRIIPVVKFSDKTVGLGFFEDSSITFNRIPKNARTTNFFVDSQIKSGVILSLSMSTTMSSYVLSGSPASDNYVADGYQRPSNGYYWGATLGADSLAFGDLKYKDRS